MSDLNQISDETSLINDELKTISISDHKSSILADESSDENDSEYEDVEEDEVIDTSILTSITKATLDEDELLINIKPRRIINKKIQDDEHSEGDEDDDHDNQNVPKTRGDTKQATKIKVILDDDNNTQSPAYIPRKGKFYEHDDRTLDENDRSKQELSRNENRLYKDSDAKWQHDLYFRDEQISKSRRRDHDRFEPRYNYNREQLHLNDYMLRSQKGHTGHHQQQYQNRRFLQETEKKPQQGRINNFDFTDYDRSSSYNRNGLNRDLITQTVPRPKRGDNNPYQIDERTFHRRRNFTNSQFQQHEDVSKFNKNSSNRIDQRQQSKENHELYENKNNLPPRFRINNNNYRNSTQKQEYQEKSISTNGWNLDRPKRYSNMRNNMINPIQQPASSQIKPYQDQHSNQFEQNDWPQAPPPPTSYLPQQMYYQQPTSPYVPINYLQGSISEQVKVNFFFVSSRTECT